MVHFSASESVQEQQDSEDWVNSIKVHFKDSQFTQLPFLQCLWAASILGMQMATTQKKKNCLQNSHLNNYLN